MKKNIMFIGMLVALLTVPAYTFAANDSIAAAPVKEKKVREPRVQVIDSTHYSLGSVVSAQFGFGNSGLWATNGTAQLQNTWGFPGFSAGVRYSYFFLNWLGFTTGLDYSTYTSTISMKGVMDWNSGVKNLLGEEYIHRLNFSGEGDAQSTWAETEDLGMIEIPIALSFKYKPNKVGLISTVGLKLGFPVIGRYSYKGTLNHIGYSNTLNYAETNDERFVSNDSYNETFKDYKKGTWSVVNAEVFGEIGALFQVSERVDLSLSVYGGYCANDVNRTAYSDRADLGFRTAQQAQRAPKMDMSCMTAYQGLVGTNAIDHINPWNLGVKIGVHIYCAKENDAERAARLAELMKDSIVYVRDTVTMTEVVRDTVEKQVMVRDTIQVLTTMLNKVTIYYKAGDSKNPIIEPADLLDEAAAILVANPAIHVIVRGYASADGGRRFNELLSENRAQRVADVLRKRGVANSQIEIESMVATDSQTDSRRCVEIIPVKR